MNKSISKKGTILVLALIVAVISCGAVFGQDGTLSNRAQVIAGVETDGCQLIIGTTNNVFLVNERIELNMMLKNLSTNAIVIKVQDGLMNYSFNITGPEGSQVPLTERGSQWLHPTSLYHQSFETVEAGQVFKRSIPLEKVFVMTNAGEYSIRVLRDTYDKKVSAGPLIIRLVEPTKH